jgi:hypothetical protein
MIERLPELINYLQRNGITSLIDLVADVGFIICVPFAIYYFTRKV